ncbi:MAG: hypothetical protein ACREYC_19815 [Gammaproteobacteria bacterium]
MNEHAEKPSLRVVVLAVGGVIYALWLIRIADDMFALELYRWGVYPRELSGLAGLLLGPLIPWLHRTSVFSKPKHLGYARWTWG